MKEFNVTGLCIPEKHYMVDISNKIVKIMEMVDKGAYLKPILNGRGFSFVEP